MENKPIDNTIFEDPNIKIVLASDAISPGHAIIDTKENYSSFKKLPKPLLDKIMRCAQVYVRIIKKIYSPKGYSIMQNEGQFSARQKVQLHIIPRFSKNEFSWVYSDVENPQAFEFKRIKETLEMQLKDMMNSES